MSNRREPRDSSSLLLRAFLLDTYIETPEEAVIVAKGKSVLISEILTANPEMLARIIEERARVYRQLGWEVPDAGC